MTSLTIILAGLFLFVTTLGLAALGAYKVLTKDATLLPEASEPPELLAGQTREVSGWQIEDTAEGYRLTRTSGGLEVTIKAMVSARTSIYMWIRVEREGGGNAPDGTTLYIPSLLQMAIAPPEEATPRLRLVCRDQAKFVVFDRELELPLLALQRVALPEFGPPITVDDFVCDATRIDLDAGGFSLRGEFNYSIDSAYALEALERQLIALAGALTWNERELKEVLEKVKDSSFSKAESNLVYASLLTGEVREDFLISLLPSWHVEPQMAGTAFRWLVEGGNKEKVGKAIWSSPVEVHEWLILNGELPALLWMFEGERQVSWVNWLVEGLQSAKGHEPFDRLDVVLEKLPNTLLAAPGIKEEVRWRIIERASTWYTNPREELAREMVTRLDGEEYLYALKHLLVTSSPAAAVALYSAMASGKNPEGGLTRFVFMYLTQYVRRFAHVFEGGEHLAFLHSLFTSGEAELRHKALGLAREVGDVNTLEELIRLRDVGGWFEPDALAYAIDALYALHQDELKDYGGQLSLADARGGELSLTRGEEGALSVSE